MTSEGDTENAKTFKKRIFLENRRQGLLKGTPILKKFNGRFFGLVLVQYTPTHVI